MKDFTFVWTILINISRKIYVYAAHPTVLAFMARDIISFNGIFSIFLTAGLIKLMVYLKSVTEY